MSDPAVIAAMADDLLSAAPFRPHAPTDGPRSFAQGYLEQDALVRHLVETGSRGPVGGYKVAANAPHLMRAFGLSEPISGRVFSDQIHQSPAALPAAGFRTFAYEPEIAAVIGARLAADAAPFTPQQIAAAVAQFVPAFELLDLRDAEIPKVHLPDALAQNLTNAGAVIGGPGSDRLPDLAELAVEVTLDGRLLDRTTGSTPEPPLEALRWLAHHLAARDLELAPGQIVLCGSHTPMRRITSPGELALSMPGLGEARLRLTAPEGSATTHDS